MEVEFVVCWELHPSDLVLMCPDYPMDCLDEQPTDCHGRMMVGAQDEAMGDRIMLS